MYFIRYRGKWGKWESWNVNPPPVRARSFPTSFPIRKVSIKTARKPTNQHYAHLLPHIATLSHWTGKHTNDPTGKRIAQMVSNGGGISDY
jgi:hypothetical protein